MEQPTLFVYPDATEYGPEDEAAMVEDLLRIGNRTLVTPPASQRELMLDESGRTVLGRRRYTATAFHQLAQTAGVGLGRLVANVAGTHRRSGQEHEAFSFRVAVQLFNTVVDLRYRSSLESRRLVINTHDKLIEGVLGPKTQYLANTDFIDMCREGARTVDEPTRFHVAKLAGRRVMIRFIHAEPFMTLPGPLGAEAFHLGYHFSNTETGDGSIRGGRILHRAVSDTAALALSGSVGGGRVVHTGREFSRRFRDLIQSALRPPTDDDLAATRAAIAALLTRPLNLTPGDDVEFGKQCRGYSSRLVARGVQRTLADRIVRRAVYCGSDEDSPPPRQQRQAIEGRTQFDLFTATMREAATLPIPLRETIEHVAYIQLFRTK